MKFRGVLIAAVVVLGLAQPPAAEAAQKKLEFDWVHVGAPGNKPDTEVMSSDRTTNYGAVAYEYDITKFLITNVEYTAFLNAVAKKDDPYLLYHPFLDRRKGYGIGSGIARNGRKGGYTYSVQKGRERRPVNYLNLFDALRFANWVNNGQGHVSTETGAYTLKGRSIVPTNWLTIKRNPNAKFALSGEDEWYKAAFYDGKKGVYYDSPAGSNTLMTCGMPGPKPNTSNCGLVTAHANPACPCPPSAAAWFWADTSDVGAYTNSVSPWGAYDMGGNLFQWTDTISYAVIGQYHAGAKVAPVLDAVNAQIGNVFQTSGIGPVGVLRGTDFGDGPEFQAANGRTNDFSFYKWETYGMRLVKLR